MWESILESAKGLLLPRLLPHQRPGCQPGELVQHHGSYMGEKGMDQTNNRYGSDMFRYGAG